MADEKLMFPIGFDLESGVDKAIQDWNKQQQKLSQTIGGKPIKVKITTDSSSFSEVENASKKAGDTAKKSFVGSALAADSYKAKLKELTIAWNNLTAAQRGGTEGRAIIDQYRQLSNAAKGNVSTIRSAANMQDKQANATKRATNEIKSQNAAFNTQIGYVSRLVTRLGVYSAIFAGLRMITNIRETTAEFELQRVALGAIIQDAQKAGQLFSQIKAAAVESPFEIKDLVSYTKQLSAYRIETENLFDTTMRLADVSAGLSVDMGRLILAYGQVKAASVLRGQELRQFTEAGIPLVQLLAYKFSILRGQMVSTGEVFELISNRAVSFSMVKEIFEDMTNAGGMFYDMQKKQAKTLAGEWSNLKDAISIAYDEMGRDVYSPMRNTVALMREMIENWRSIANVATVVGGIYAVIAIKNAFIKAEQQKFNALLGQEEALRYKNIIATSKQALEQKHLSDILASGQGKSQLRLGKALGFSMPQKDVNAIVADAKAIEGLTAEIAKQGIALGQTTKKQRIAFVQTGLLTDAEVKSAKAIRNSARMYNLYSMTIGKVVGAVKMLGAALASNVILLAVGAIIAVITKWYNKNKELAESIDKLRTQVRVYANELKDAYKSISNVVDKGLAVGSSDEDIRKATVSLQLMVEKNEALKPLVRDRLKDITTEAERLTEIKNIWDDIVEATDGNNSELERLVELMTNAQNATDGYFDEGLMTNMVDVKEGFADISKELSDLASRGVHVSDIQKGLSKMSKEGKSTSDMINFLNNSLKKLRLPSGATQEPLINLTVKVTELQKEWVNAQGDAKKYWDYVFASIKEFNGEQIDRDKPFLGLSPENFRKFQVQLSLAKNEISKTLDDALKTAFGYFNELSNAVISPTIKFFYSPQVEPQMQLSGWQERFNSFISGMSESTIREFKRTESNIEESTSQLLEKTLTSMSTYTKLIADATNKDIMLFEGVTSEERKKKQKEEIALYQQRYEEAKKISDLLGRRETDDGGDKRLQNLQREVELVREIYKRYKEYLDYMSPERAKSKIKDLYGDTIKQLKFGVAFDDESLKETLTKYKNAISKLPKSEQATLKLTLDIDTVDFDQLKDKLKKNLDNLSSEIERQQTSKNFFEKMLGITGDRELAMTLTMSIYGDMGAGLADKMKEQLKAAFAGVNIEDALSGDQIDYTKLSSRLNGVLEANKKNAEDLVKQGIQANAEVIANLYSTLGRFDDYEGKRMTIMRKGIEERKQIELQSIAESEKAELKRLSKESEKKQLARISFEDFKDSDLYITMFENLDFVSTRVLDNLKSKLEDLKNKVGESLDPTQMKELVQKMQEVDSQLTSRNPFKSLVTSIKEYREELKLQSRESRETEFVQATAKVEVSGAAVEDYDKRILAQEKVVDETIKEYGALSNNAFIQKAILDSLNSQRDIAGKTLQTDKAALVTATNKLKVLSASEKAMYDGISGVRGGVDGLSMIASSMKKLGETFDWGDEFSMTMDSIGEILGGLDSIGQGIQSILSGNIFSGIGQIFSGVVDTVAGIFGATYIKRVAAANREIERQAKLLERLEYSYGRLQKAAEDALGVDAITNYNEQYENLLAQAAAAEKQAAAERSKGKKEDEEKTKEYMDAARDARDEAADLMKDFSKQIFGVGLADYAKDIASVWLEAKLSGENTMDALNKKWKETMRDMVANTLMAKAIEEALKPVFDKIDKLAKSPSLIEDPNWWAGLAGQLATSMENSDEILTNLYKILEQQGINLKEGESTLTGISKNIANASEESILTLAAGINTQNFYISGIYQSVNEIKAVLMQGGTGGVDFSSLITVQNSYLQQLPNIALHTANTVAECRTLVLETRRIADNLDRVIKPLGVKSGHAINTQLN